jgi:hypothetical protein
MIQEVSTPELWAHAARIAREHGPRAAAVAAAIRKAQARALEIAVEADMDGRPGIARALRRKVEQPRAGDVRVVHLADRVRVQIGAYGVAAEGSKGTRVPR